MSAEKKTITAEDIIEMVEEYLESQPCYYDLSHIWWKWNPEEYRWVIVDETTIINDCYEKLELAKIVQPGIKSMMLNALMIRSRAREPFDLRQTWIQCSHQIIDFETMKIEKVYQGYMATNPIPWMARFNEPTPTIDKLFGEWVGDQAIQLKEIIAFCLAPTYFLHRIFVLIGSGSNGKSCFLSLLRKFIGDHNVCTTELEDLIGNRFESAKLFKKSACIMGETNFSIISKTSKLKQLCGGDHVSFEFKNKNPFSAPNYAKIIIATNGLPATTDRSDGFYRRFMIINFANKFSEKKDIIATIPDDEFNALAGQCVEILRKLWVNREFTNEGAIEERARKYEEYSNPLSMFIEKKCDKSDPNAWIAKWEFRDAFETYCKQNGHRKFSEREIATLMQEMGFEERRQTEEPRYRGWIGINLSKMACLSTHSNTRPYARVCEDEVRLAGQKGQVGQNDFLSLIRIMDRGAGVSYEQLLQVIDDTCLFVLINESRSRGDICEVRPGFWKVLE